MTEDEKKKCEVCGVELHWSPLVEGLPQMSSVSDCRHVVQLLEPSMTPIPPIPTGVCRYCLHPEHPSGTMCSMHPDLLTERMAPYAFTGDPEDRSIPPIPEDRLEQLANDPMMCNISPEVKLCLQELIEARQSIAKLTAANEELEAENTRLKAALTKPIETDEARRVGLPLECDDPDEVKAIERLYASRATRTPPQEGQ